MTLKQLLIPIHHQTEWESQLKDIPHGACHLWSYNHAIMQSNNLSTYLYSANAPGFRAICPLAVRNKYGKKDIFTPYGFGGMIMTNHYPDFNNYSKKFFLESNFVCGYLALHPTLCKQIYFDPSEIYAGNNIYILDLTLPLENLLLNLKKVHRYELQQWQKEKITLTMDKTILKKALPTLYKETLNRVNASPVYHFSDNTLEKIIDSQNSIVLGVFNDNAIEAISIFLYTPYIADYFLLATTIEGRKHTRGLIWKTILILKELNVLSLNLGGGVRSGDQLEDFKRRFGGKQHAFYAAKQIYDSSTFLDLCQRENINPAIVKYFPPYYSNEVIS